MVTPFSPLFLFLSSLYIFILLFYLTRSNLKFSLQNTVFFILHYAVFIISSSITQTLLSSVLCFLY
jgi:hypothetical protein